MHLAAAHPRGIRAAALLMAVLLGACAGSPRAALLRGDHLMVQGSPARARRAYEAAAGHRRASAGERVTALIGAARACAALGNDACAERQLRRAIDPEVAGASEPALYHLAERLRTTDRAAAMNLYYRAAAGAARHRRRGFPYDESMARIVELSARP